MNKNNLGYLEKELHHLADEVAADGQEGLTEFSQEEGGNALIVATILHKAADLVRLAFELKYPNICFQLERHTTGDS